MPRGIYLRTPENTKNLHPPSRKGSKLTEEHKNILRLSWIKLNKEGKLNYWKGKKQPLEVVEKKRKTMLAKLATGWRAGKRINYKHSEETKRKIGKANSGSNSNWWKGGITPINLKIRTSAKYNNWRKQVFERDNYTCQICGQRGGKLNADHIKPFSLFPELRFELSNGRTLCLGCHRKTGTFAKRFDLVKDFSVSIWEG